MSCLRFFLDSDVVGVVVALRLLEAAPAFGAVAPCSGQLMQPSAITIDHNNHAVLSVIS